MCSQQLTACQYIRQINPVHARPFYFFMIHFNVILPPMPRSSKFTLSFKLPNQNPACYYFSDVKSQNTYKLFLPKLPCSLRDGCNYYRILGNIAACSSKSLVQKGNLSCSAHREKRREMNFETDELLLRCMRINCCRRHRTLLLLVLRR